MFGFLGWLWFLVPDDSVWRTVSLVAVLALATFVAITWYLAVRAEGRWRTALDRYAEQEGAKRTHHGKGIDVEGESDERNR
jgi:hypothetical protein